MIYYLFAAVFGGILAAFIAFPYGIYVAAFCMPLGGSSCVLLAAISITMKQNEASDDKIDLDAQTDAMVTSLRLIVSAGRPTNNTDKANVTSSIRKHG